MCGVCVLGEFQKIQIYTLPGLVCLLPERDRVNACVSRDLFVCLFCVCVLQVQWVV